MNTHQAFSPLKPLLFVIMAIPALAANSEQLRGNQPCVSANITTKDTDMSLQQKCEIERRTKVAFSAIKAALSSNDEDDAVNLFVSHHLEEIEGSYWKKHTGKSSPSPSEVVGILSLDSHWSDEDDDGIDIFDFTLPDEATNYLISVEFNEEGNVEDISLES